MRPGFLAATACIAVAGCEPLVAGLDLRRCKPAPGTTGTPSTIAEAVELANGLPFPVTAECFVEALDRPLAIAPTASTSSAQPAAGRRSPRVLIWPTDDFIVTVALDGAGRNLIEFGQFVAEDRSIKGELEFPLAEPATTAQALQRVRNPEYPNITTCFVCHDDERDEPSVPGGRSSEALRPFERTLVDLQDLPRLRDECDWTAEPDRCRYLHALVDPGPLTARPFDPTWSRL